HDVTEGRGIDGGGPEIPGLSAMQIVVWRYAPPGARRRSGRIVMRKNLFGGILAATALAMLGSSALAEPEIVSGPPAEPECFVPWRAETAFFKFPAKEGPYRIALANG